MESPVQRLAACVIAALLFVLLGAPSSQATTSSLRYVALGDSYSAASGVLPPDPTAHPMCLRSTSNYPHLIAAATRAQLTDVTCGGADTGDYYAPQYDGVPPQLDAVTAEADLVTMTIGGNDSGVFIDSIVQCGMAGASTGGQGSPCKDRYGSSFRDTIRTTTYPALVKALRKVQKAAPDAEVAILGYPWIMPKSVGCFDRMPVAEGDVPYVRGIQATLNDAVRRAAAATGATYVNMNRVSEGHDACQPIGVRWIEPVLQGTNAVVVHPNALGEEQMAAQAMKVLGLR
jgi:lysophospholipase L1-like esterase